MPDDQGITVITSIATHLHSVQDEERIYEKVYAFHRDLAAEFAGTANPLKKWRVIVSSAALRSGPGPTFSAVAYAKQGDVVFGNELNTIWLHVGSGWIKTTQVEAIE